ncbi:MAG TPA: hypothetical protein VMT85_16185 [Thermoanaerobaculia bacterium]|nr:hypothetical protein [Thermoanaerobaculia bacterium]
MHWKLLSLAAASAAAAMVALAGAALAQAPGDALPERAEDIRPLLIGAEVPSVEVRTLDGDAVDLRDIVRRKPTILLFYRGGW